MEDRTLDRAAQADPPQRLPDVQHGRAGLGAVPQREQQSPDRGAEQLRTAARASLRRPVVCAMWPVCTASISGPTRSIRSCRPLPIDVNRGDILNLFLDVNVIDWNGAPVVARVGRQELLFGSQRLISTLDWANTRRTFEGVRTFRRGEKWDLDAFWVQFVLPLADEFDRPEENQDFMGTWATYRPEKGEFTRFLLPVPQQLERLRASGHRRSAGGIQHRWARGGPATKTASCGISKEPFSSATAATAIWWRAWPRPVWEST